MAQTASSWRKYRLLMLAGLGAWVLNTMAASIGAAAANAAALSLPAVWLLTAAWLRTDGRWTNHAWTSLILMGGFLAGLCFILKLPYNFSWHDLASYSADFSVEAKPDGHLGYVAWIVENGALPLMDPRAEGYSVFYNPPLYHLLQAGFMRLNLWLGTPQAVALENLQVVTLLCASACAMVGVDLLRFWGAGERGVRTGALVMAFQPSLWILGATLNNDILSILCILACMLFTVRWERTRRLRDIMGAALSLGAGMASKLSAALLIPCVAVVFAAAFFRDLKRWRRYAGQFATFLAVSVPPAVAWPLYHLLAYEMPLNYVRLPAETIYVGHLSLWKRFGVPDWYARRELFYTGVRKTDHNVWMQTFKTGVFDELTLFEKGTATWYASYALMALFAGLLFVGLILFVRALVRRRSNASGLASIFLGMYGAAIVIHYIQFCLDYPYLSTFNFRYIAPVLALCALGFADGQDHAGRFWRPARYAALFAALAAGVYGVWFFLPAISGG